MLKTESSPTDNRKFDGYFQDRLYAMDTVVCLLIDGTADPELGLSTLNLSAQLAHKKASEFMAEVEGYILELETKLDAVLAQVPQS